MHSIYTAPALVLSTLRHGLTPGAHMRWITPAWGVVGAAPALPALSAPINPSVLNISLRTSINGGSCSIAWRFADTPPSELRTTEVAIRRWGWGCPLCGGTVRALFVTRTALGCRQCLRLRRRCYPLARRYARRGAYEWASRLRAGVL